MHADDVLHLKYVICDAELVVMLHPYVHHHECVLHLLGLTCNVDQACPNRSAVGNELERPWQPLTKKIAGMFCEW